MLCLRHKVVAEAAHALLSSRPQGRQTFHPPFSDALCTVFPAPPNLKVGLLVGTLWSMQHIFTLTPSPAVCCRPGAQATFQSSAVL